MIPQTGRNRVSKRLEQDGIWRLGCEMMLRAVYVLELAAERQVYDDAQATVVSHRSSPVEVSSTDSDIREYLPLYTLRARTTVLIRRRVDGSSATRE
jgi:hypothetical protein